MISEPLKLFRTSIFQKIIMAVTGVVLFGFVLGHMAGNLQVFLGERVLNEYAEYLQSRDWLVWGTRVGLLVAVGLHIWAAVMLTRQNVIARPVRYEKRGRVKATLAALTMRLSAVIIVAFVIYHLLHLTLGSAHPDFMKGEVFHNVVTGFGIWWVSVAYIVSMIALGFHLRHGLWSMLQTVGINHPRVNKYRDAFATVFTALIVIGNIMIPLAVMLGLVG